MFKYVFIYQIYCFVTCLLDILMLEDGSI